MKFFQALQSGLNEDQPKWASDLLDELETQRTKFLKDNIQEHKDFKSLLKFQDEIRDSIDKLVTELPDNFDDLTREQQDELKRNQKQNKETQKQFESLSDSLDRLRDGDASSIDKLSESISKLKEKGFNAPELNSNIVQETGNSLNKGSGLKDALINLAGKKIGSAAGEMGLGGLGMIGANPYLAIGKLIFDGISFAVKGALTQITELNDQMIGLERATGGVITAEKLGMDVYGKMSGTWKSLKTEAIAANVSVEQITESLKSFSSVDNGFGIFGSSSISGNRIKSSSADSQTQKDLHEFGIESARIKKLYNADIVPAVQGMFKNWGVSIGDASDAMVDGVREMRLEGLSPEIWSKNMESMVKMSGKLSFANGVSTMKNISTMATRLGVSVESIVDGFSQMKGFTDVFEKQAEMSALGMAQYGRNLGKIYALRKSGNHAEASALEIQSVAGDLKSKGLANFNTGEISQQGIEFMDAMGMSQEQIQGMQQATKLASMKMKQLGWSLNDALKPLNQLTEAQKNQAIQLEKNNITITEGVEKFKNQMKDQLFSRVAEGLIPLIETLSEKFLGTKSSKTMLGEDLAKNNLGVNDMIDMYNNANPNSKINVEKKKTFMQKMTAKGLNLYAGGVGGLLGVGGAVSAYKSDMGGKLIDYYTKKRKINTDDLDMSQQQTVQGALEWFKNLSPEEQKNQLKALGKSEDEINKFTQAIKTSTETVNKQIQTEEERIKQENEQKRKYISQNISAALDRAMRDLVTYGKVGKNVNTQTLSEQYDEMKKNSDANNANNTNINVNVNSNTDLAKTTITHN